MTQRSLIQPVRESNKGQNSKNKGQNSKNKGKCIFLQSSTFRLLYRAFPNPTRLYEPNWCRKLNWILNSLLKNKYH